MALYAIGDLHLALSTNKAMDVFGGNWVGYVDKIRSGFSHLTDGDTTVLCGDSSWGMNLDQALEDFKFIDSLPGKKLLIKGNHDYWWATAKKLQTFFVKYGLATIDIIHNNSFIVGDVAVCGTRGWFYEEDRESGSFDKKIFDREICRLEFSLKHASAGSSLEKVCFLHYPPICEGYCCNEIVELMRQYEVSRCYYGHLHGYGHKKAVEGAIDGITYALISSDYLGFKPVKI